MDSVVPPMLPLSELDELRISHSLLGAEVQALRPIEIDAQYVSGVPGCAGEDRDCEEYFDADGNALPGVDWCSHVEQRHATYADVLVRERYEWLAMELLGLLNRPSDDLAARVREAIHATVLGLIGDDISNVDLDREPYKTVLAEDRVDDLLTAIEIANPAT